METSVDKPRRKRRRRRRKKAEVAGVTVRTGGPEDAPAVVSMVAAANRAELKPPFDAVDEEFLGGVVDAATENGHVLVCEAGEKIVGACLFTLSPLYYNPAVTVATVFVRWVEPEFRGRGAGALLMSGAERSAREHGADLVSPAVLAGPSGPKIAGRLLASGYRLAESYYVKGL